MTDKGKTKEQLLKELKKLQLENQKLKESERAVRESEERYREFADNIPDGFFEFDLQGNITFFNESTSRIFGYTHDEFINLDRYKRHESREYAKQVFRQYAEMYEKNISTKVLEHRIVRKDGEVREIESSASLIRGENGTILGYRGIVRDITERKKMQRDLERYRDFFENVEDLCAEYDLQGNITLCNKSVPRTFGYTRKEFMKLDRYERHESREYGKYVFRMFAEMFRSNVSSKIMDYRIKCRDGSVRNLEARISLVRDSKGAVVGFRGIGHDITERKKMQQELERYRDFFENVGDICVEYDLSGRCTFCNQATTRVLGFSKEEILSLRHHERYESKEEADRIFRIVREAFIKRLPVTVYVSDLLCSDGTFRALENSVSLITDSDGTPVGFRSISRDVTERQKMQEDLLRYREFFENVEDVCAEYNLNGKCTFCNQAAARLFGYPVEKVLALRHHERYPTKEEADRVYRKVHDMFSRRLSGDVLVSDILRSDGTTRTMEASMSLIMDSKGTPMGFRSIARDITDRRKMEEEQDRLREQLVRVRKMEAIGTLAGGVAHDFNNLLMGIQGYVSLMLLEIDQEDSRYEQLRAIESHVKSGADLTRQLLGYARGGRYEVKPINLNDIIRKSVEMFGRTKREIVINQDLAEDLWIIDADSSQVEQVLLNLFVNAWQAMPGGGEISIKTININMDSFHGGSLEISPGPYVRLTVSDTGIGMDEVTREHLFEPFFTTKEMGGTRGTGLGLASVYGIVKGHRGAIKVQSEKGKGATFNIFLPASSREAIMEIDTDKRTLQGSETVLLVDDEKTIREIVGKLIRGLGYKVVTAGSGEEAVSIYRKDQAVIDLVIMDMIMPGLSGGAAIDEIRSLNPGARIILSSGYSLDGEAQEILDRGGIISFIQKPFQLSELSQKIRNILDR